ncbi:hypothetical protein GCM10009633_23510 [Janibacter melonis]|uniref:hypothetical protein n=1 Tax=Janibacter melonis TaxID=262209 RepID=UPI001E2B33B1|nr:hypothetical protein [Janibacter melonis]MCB5993181.1 hypothetical protein [Janibacter melonis]
MSEDIRLAAQQLMDGRLAAIDGVAAKAREVEEARTALEDAERSYATAYKSAQDAGWTDRELRHLSLPIPGRRGPGRPRKKAVSPAAQAPRDGNSE